MSARRGSLSTGSSEFRKIFDGADEDRDGMLNVAEFVLALNSMPEGSALSDDEALEAFLEVDTDDDGFVTWAEFKAAFEEDDDDGQPVLLTNQAEAAAANAALFDSDDDDA